MFSSHITASLTHTGVVELIEDVLLHADVVREGVEVDGGGRGHADAGAAVARRRALLGLNKIHLRILTKILTKIVMNPNLKRRHVPTSYLMNFLV